jgi:hypothetical protein
LGKVLEKPVRKIMPVEEPRRKRKRGIEEPDRYPEPKRETKPQIVPARPAETTQESSTGNEMNRPESNTHNEVLAQPV